MLIGLVGKPSSGKSTFFKAATLAEVAIASYPFTTLEPNQGVGFVRVDCPENDIEILKQQGKKCNPQHGFCLNGQRFVPLKLLDVAGLVPEAHKGKGRGNEFLDDLREADLLIHILDVSGKTDAQGNPTQDYDITKDVSFLVQEIEMWIVGILKRNWTSLKRKARAEKFSKVLAEQLSGLKIREEDVKEIMNKLQLEEKPEWQEKQIIEFAKEIRNKSKPIIIAANKSDTKKAEQNIDKIKKEFPDLFVVPCSADSELALREAAKAGLIEYIPGDSKLEIKGELSEKQKKALETIKKDVLDKYGDTGVQEILNKAVFSFLNYIVVFPVENENHFSSKKNNILPDAYLLPPDSKALDLAYAIHSDIGNNFVSALDARTKRKLSKDSILKNRDVVKIMAK
jgi:hypothetical protein